MTRPLIRRIVLFTVALTSLVLVSSCKGKAPPEPLRELPTPYIDAEKIPAQAEALREWSPPSPSGEVLRVDASWPPLTEKHGIRAPEGEAFLWVLPLPSADGATSFLAATVPTHALKPDLYSSFAVQKPPMWSLLLYPSHDALAAGEDSDIQRIDELSNLYLPPRGDEDAGSDSALFYAELTQDRLVRVCVPGVSSEPGSGRVASVVASSCEFYLWNADGALQSLPRSLQGDSSFAAAKKSSVETSIDAFFLDDEGTLHSQLSVPLPTFVGELISINLAIAWDTAPLQTQGWSKTQLSKELKNWLGVPLEQCDEPQLLYAAGRLLALRFLASDVIETQSDYLKFEADVLLQIASIAEHHWGRWEAWAWLAQLNDLLDQHADQTLARPQASLMLVPEHEEKPSLAWRGEGHLLDRAIPATWLTSGTETLLRLPRTAGVRYCNGDHCLRALPHPSGASDAEKDADPTGSDAAGPDSAGSDSAEPNTERTNTERAVTGQIGAGTPDAFATEDEDALAQAETAKAKARAEAQARAAEAEAAAIPSLIHPEGHLQFVECWPEEHDAWSLVFTTTQRQQRCEPNALCSAACDDVAYANLSRLSKFQGACYARVPLSAPNSPRQTRVTDAALARLKESAPQDGTCWRNLLTREKPQPLFWLDGDTLLFSDAAGFYQASVSKRTWLPFDERGLIGPQRSVAGIDSKGSRYILRHVANELSVWKQTGDTLELLGLPNLRHPAVPQSDHGWALPNPEGTELAVIFGGQLLGVWELSTPLAKTEPDPRHNDEDDALE